MQEILLKTNDGKRWWIWSDNTDEKTLSCLPYQNRDWDGLFVFDLKEFRYDEVSTIIGQSHLDHLFN